MLVRGLFAASALLFGAFGSATAHAQDVDPDGDGKGGACSAFVEKNPLPGFAGVQAQFGPTQTGIAFGSSYLMINTSVPEPIPIRLSCSDTDTLYKKCLRDCIKHDVGGYWTAEWTTLDIGFGGARGSFIDPNGNLVPSVADAQHAVYLPPRDIACGTYRSVGIRARIFDPGPDAAFLDSPVDVYFQVDVWRPSSPSPSYYWVMITPFLPTPSDAKPPECPEPPDTCCKYIGGTTLPDAGISAGVSWQPSGMLVNDIRTIVLKAGDMDRVVYECGVPPKCPSTFANEPFGDGLTYTWTVLNGPATILRGGRTALIQAGATAGKVDLQVVIDDCTGFCADDPPVTLNITLYVYELDFIDSGNAKLPKLAPVTTQNEGLRISQVVTNTNMNGAGGLGAPNFAGPVPAPVDPRTYRTEIARGGAPAAWPFTVRIQTTHAWPAADYEGGAAYNNVFATLPPGGGVLRSDLHMRLVSNKVPLVGAVPGGVSDDSVCGAQSILAIPGDWVTATLNANGIAVGSIELPVERPWNEAGLPAASPQTIKEMTALFIATADAIRAPVQPTWNSVMAFHAKRVLEDYAQAALRARPAANAIVGGPYLNAAYVFEVPPPGGGYPPGPISVNVTVNGVLSGIPVTFTPADNSLSGADAIALALDQAGIQSSVAPLNIGTVTGYLILAGVGSATTSLTSINLNGTGFPVVVVAQNHADGVFDIVEMAIQAGNLKPVQGPAQTTLDYFVVRDAAVFQPGTIGFSLPPANPLVGPNPALRYSMFLANAAGEGSDVDYSTVVSHELWHYLTQNGLHPGPLAELPCAGGLYPAGPNHEDPTIARRLPNVEIAAIRAGGVAFFADICVPIPNRP